MTSDFQVRIEALNPSSSFICEAPAGSGKTELLTQRVLTLLARVNVPESVLAITFTRKAAAEMQARVLSALAAGHGERPTDEHRLKTWLLARDVLQVDAKMGWNLLQNPNRLSVKTFDGLSRLLTQALPLQASIDAHWQPSDEPDQLYQEAAQDFLDTLEKDVPWSDSLKILFRHVDNRYEVLERLLVAMLTTRDTWMPVLGVQGGQDLRPLLQGFLEITLADKVERLGESILAEHQKTLLALCEFAGANAYRLSSQSVIGRLRDINQLPDSSAEGVSYWQAIAELLLTKDNKSWRKRLSKNEGFPVGENKQEKSAFKNKKTEMTALLAHFAADQDALSLLREIRFWPSLGYTETQWQVLSALTQVLPIAVVHLHWVFRRKKTVDFTEISQRARQALGEEDSPTDIALRLDHAIQHILVDEFQDTSFTQVDLLKKLTYGWEPDDGRTLFCVGDAMQSIYGFRGANVGLFLHCKSAGLGPLELKPLQLTANFRSQAGLVTWVNKTFLQAFPASVDISSGAVPYNMAEPFRAQSPHGSVSTHIFEPRSGPAEPQLSPAQWLVQTIQELWLHTPNATIGVLVKSRSHATAIVTALEAANILYRAIDLVPLKQRPIIQDLYTLTQALLFPGDRIAWLAVLRAPWCGLSLTDLSCVTVSGAKHTLLWQMQSALEAFEQNNCANGASTAVPQTVLHDQAALLSPEGYQRLARVTGVMADAIGQRSRKSLVGAVEGVWRALGGQCFFTDIGDGDNIERFWQMLEAFEQKGQRPSRESLERAMAKLYAAPNPKACAKLQIMTIHKSKGLEFDRVFLPELHRGAAANDAELLLWNERLSKHGAETVLFAPISAAGSDKDPIYQHLDFEHKKRLKLEACRLLYVACTRARERLYLMACLGEDNTGAEQNSRFSKVPAGSLLSYIWPSVERTAIKEGRPEPHQETHQTQTPNSLEPVDDGLVVMQQKPLGSPLTRAVTHWQPPPKPETNLLAEYIIYHQYDNQDRPDFSAVHAGAEVARFVGTVVHEAAVLLARAKITANLDLAQWQPQWRARLAMLGTPQSQLQTAVVAVERALTRLVVHPKFFWLVNQPTVLLEYPVTMKRQGEIHNYIFDVLVVTEQKQAWVIDYKTSEPAPGEAQSEFLQRERKTYEPIMRAYQRAATLMGYSGAKSALFFVCTGSWLEL